MPKCWFCYKETQGKATYHEKCCKKFFGTATAPVLALGDAVLEELAKKTVNRRIAVTGVQPKLSLTLNKTKGLPRLTIVGLWGEYILKPQHHHFPFMPECEDLTMHLASLFKINVCAHTLLQSTDETLVYLDKRFDRQNGLKIHMEDFCQLSELLTENKYKSSYEKAGKVILRYCTNKGLDAVNYFERLLFCFLCGNNDMHLKNFSLLYTNDAVLFSPAYDLVNVNLVNPKDREQLGMTLNGKKRNIKKDDFISLARALGLSAKAVENVFKKLSGRNDDVRTLIDASFLDEEAKKSYQKIWSKNQDILFETN